ncbi:MAG TPA: chlorophyll synthase ChlG [Rhodospirillaceae bacterium]|nr:chlorophyll synthase ChlG [Rhodospirillaceae bacterium]
MDWTNAYAPSQAYPSARAVVELFKPITWFAPMWAFFCGVVSSGVPVFSRSLILLGGVMLAGPLICATSQAVNDWFDRHVDAINEPGRPIPSGRIPGRWGLRIAVIWSLISVVFSYFLGIWVFWAAVAGLFLSWAYSAPPMRLKQNGWWGPAAVALSYEGIAWFTGAAVMTATLPDWRIILLAALYSLGAHGIMTLNDFKAIEGDRQMGIRSLPVILGVDRAARLACAVMVLPQLAVAVELWVWNRPIFAFVVSAAIVSQLLLMVRLLRDPRKYAPWYNATGTSLYVSGMLVAAFAVRVVVGS